jgi:hypothetical protein
MAKFWPLDNFDTPTYLNQSLYYFLRFYYGDACKHQFFGYMILNIIKIFEKSNFISLLSQEIKNQVE